ncbi:T9SS type A sorting domain-containing protein [Rasiella sp. SM2506]|uniref:T9SS type A sorting domain-containing protein n=1 Tax=Rasiella sp. SM2506 TaxID=3423914 RepID=UPI003D7B7996
MKKFTLLLVLSVALGTSQTKEGPQYFINELDADQDGTDTLEFIELKTNPANASLDGMILVLFNGNHTVNGSYNVLNLDGFTTDGNGLFIIGDDAVPGVDIAIGTSNKIQNGPDAIALYFGVPSDFPTGTTPTTTNLVDALVYAKGEADDVDLLLALNETTQYNEDLNNNSELESLQRLTDGTYCTAPTTLDLENSCATCSFEIIATNSTCDTNSSSVDKTTVAIDFEGGGTEVFNITLTTGTGTIGGDDPSNHETGTIIISEVNENTVLTVNISSATCAIATTITTIPCEPTGEVATIAQLRTGILGETYTLTGEAIITYQQVFRGQKFIEDATAAILIDDPNGSITTQYATNNGVTGITGVLSEFNGQLQFLPESDPGPPSSLSNSVIPQAVSIEQLNTTPEDFESEFVQIAQGVDIDNSINTTWIADQVYGMFNPNGTFNFRTAFFEANYLGLEVPTNNVNIAGIITERNGTYYLTSRSLNDVNGIILSNNQVTQSTFTIYPNPTHGDFINITSTSAAEMGIAIYTISGQLLLHTISRKTINISTLKSGLYLLKITQDGITATGKLVVK